MLRAVLASILLLSGCAPMHWVKQDADAEQLATDRRECQEQAYREAQTRFAWLPGRMGPTFFHGPFNRRFNLYPIGPFADPYGEQFMEEFRLTNFCMRVKGYELAPAAKPKL